LREVQNQTPCAVTSVDELIEHFDVFLLDQFGVLHNGTEAFPGSHEALQVLAESGKTCVIISNSGKRAEVNAARLEKFGFGKGSYHSVMTSGEVAWRHLRHALAAGDYAAGACVFTLANDGDNSLLSGLDFTSVNRVADAELVLLAGMGAQRQSLDEYLQMFEPVIERAIPCICTNPDKLALSPTGNRFSVGKIAEELEQRTSILDTLDDVDRSRIICVGDSVEHDIAGAAAAGPATALVRTGILEALTDEEREAIYRQYDATPDYILPTFK